MPGEGLAQAGKLIGGGNAVGNEAIDYQGDRRPVVVFTVGVVPALDVSGDRRGVVYPKALPSVVAGVGMRQEFLKDLKRQIWADLLWDGDAFCSEVGLNLGKVLLSGLPMAFVELNVLLPFWGADKSIPKFLEKLGKLSDLTKGHSAGTNKVRVGRSQSVKRLSLSE